MATGIPLDLSSWRMRAAPYLRASGASPLRGIALVAQLLSRMQLVEQRCDRLRRGRVRRELARQFDARMLTTHQVAQRPGFQLLGRVALVQPYFSARLRVGRCSTFLSSAGSAAAIGFGAPTPALARIFASISRASAAFSFRKSRALSLPWPMRSLVVDVPGAGFLDHARGARRARGSRLRARCLRRTGCRTRPA